MSVSELGPVLVANRGEIAVRVLRTVRALGLRSVAVYSDADAGAPHVAAADEAVRLGPAAARESYLSIPALLSAAASTGARSVHPGYGFLAENAAFARACGDAGLVFVGPPPRAIEVMGDKIRAKRTVAAAGVPVVPGRAALHMADPDLVAAAEEIGYPVLVKPSAGGGGKGMRVVTSAADLPDALVSARREAAASFGDDTLFLERYVSRPRHIEVQVLGDTHGTVVHLGERECSLQRRHQKIVEEAPSPLLDSPTRARIGAAAVETARAVGYTGAGTVEFIVSADAPGEFFFLEMNTRLQVEHPVTELVTGLDLVAEQLRVAAGEPLGYGQADVRLDGHAVEARVYAEDPASGFLPSAGTVLVLRSPSGPGVRVDSGIAAGQTVGTDYDPMLAKVIGYGPDRAAALARLDAALADTAVLGLRTNVAFLRALLAHPDVVAGRLDTGLVERDLDRLVAGPNGTAASPAADGAPAGPPAGPPALDGAAEAAAVAALAGLAEAWPAGGDLWAVPSGWRGARPAAPLVWRFAPTGAGTEVTRVTVTGSPEAAEVTVGDGEPVPASVRLEPVAASATAAAGSSAAGSSASRSPVTGDLIITLGGRTRRWAYARAGRTTWLGRDGAACALTEAGPAGAKAAEAEAVAEVRSPMPGTVIAVPVAAGDTVDAGEPLVVVEAMKMEHTLRAPRAGTVKDLPVGVGDQVELDQVLAVVDAVVEAPDA